MYYYINTLIHLSMITLKGISFGYDHRKLLFDHLDLKMPSGQIHGILGLNGAGKSSLLHLLQGLRYHEQGEISVYGQIPDSRSVPFLQNSFLLAEEVFTPDISIKNFIDRYSPYYPNYSTDAFLKFLNEFELDRSAHLGRMSMGQRKKTMIAFGLATHTKVLLMDEPTNGLDIPSKKQFRKILSHIITEDRTFVISTHQIRDLHSLIDNVIVIQDGKIIFNHNIQAILDHLHFSLDHHQIERDDLIYRERVPGGYLHIRPKQSDESFEPDLEVLFNAIVTKGQTINQAFA